ncbi:DUF2938 domain-containing protein [Haloechinothrix sp. LS1_15]|nr:DUF2938 domain-containing protein [Haloechinothrix sp. LS1_15]
MRIRFGKAVLAGLVGTLVFDIAGLLMKREWWDTPAMLGTNLDLGLAGGVPAHYAIGIVLAIIYAGIAPSLWGPDWVRALMFMTVQTVLGVWLFLQPLLGMGIAGLEAGPLVPVISLAGHWAFGLVLAVLYPVRRSASAEQVATANR